MEVVVIIFSTESTSTIRSIVHVYFFKPVENLFYNKTYKQQQKNNSIAVRWFCCFKLSPNKDDGLSTAQD